MDGYTQCANSIFEQPWWLDIVATDSWKEITVEENGEIIGRLPIVIYKIHFRTIIKMPKLTQTLGPWIKYRECKKGNEHLGHQKEVINKLLNQLPKCSYFKTTLDTSNKYVLPYIWRGYQVKPTFSYRITELTDEGKLYENLSKTAKKNIHSAEKKVKITNDTDAERLINILKKTFVAQGRSNPMSVDIVRKIIEVCDRRNSGIMFSAIDEKGNVHACSYFVFDKNVFYYLISGSDPKFRSSGAQSLILWEAIRFASTVSEVFDFEGSMVESIENYFKQFGGTLIVNYEIRKISLVFELYELLRPKIKKILKYKQ